MVETFVQRKHIYTHTSAVGGMIKADEFFHHVHKSIYSLILSAHGDKPRGQKGAVLWVGGAFFTVRDQTQKKVTPGGQFAAAAARGCIKLACG
jgi:hypothetical protein